MNCKNCNYPVNHEYCPKCGHPAKLKRIDRHYIVHEIVHVLHVEKGLLYTIRELLLRPGKSVRQFITENRNRLIKPIIFIIITSLIYSFVNHLFHIEEGYVNYQETTKSTSGVLFKWVQDHYGYANIIMGVFIALWLKLFFRKHPFNFFEILILLCFVMGMGMLIFALFALFQGLLHVQLMSIAGVVGIAYTSWAIGQFFDKKKPLSYIKAFSSYILGMITSMLALLLIGNLIDLMIK